jgi:hypothetical protein
VPAHRSRGRSLQVDEVRSEHHSRGYEPQQTQPTGPDGLRASRVSAQVRGSRPAGGGGEARRRGGATAGGLKAYRSHPLPYATTSTEAVPLDHDDSEPPDPGRRAPQGHHVEAVALVDCRPLRWAERPYVERLATRGARAVKKRQSRALSA